MSKLKAFILDTMVVSHGKKAWHFFHFTAFTQVNVTYGNLNGITEGRAKLMGKLCNLNTFTGRGFYFRSFLH